MQFFLSLVRPKLKVKPFNTTIHEGNSAMMHCVATGDPRPTIEWDKNNRINAYDQSRFKVVLLSAFYSVSQQFRAADSERADCFIMLHYILISDVICHSMVGCRCLSNSFCANI